MNARPDEQDERAGKVRWLGPERAEDTGEAAARGAEGAVASPPESAWRDFLRRRWWMLLVALLIALVAWRIVSRMGAAEETSAASRGAVPLVSVVQPGVSAVDSRVTFNGTIQARHEMPIGPEGDGGRIAAVRVEIGDRVRRGQVLATLDTSVARPQVERLEASLEEARATANLRQAEYERAQGVQASGALSAEEIERRRSAAITAEAQVKVAAAQLEEARARLRRTQIVAPDDGIVLTRDAEVGQTATVGGEPLFRLARNAEVEMVGQVAEQDLPALRIGQPAEVRITGVAEPFAGKVRLLGAVIDPQTRLGLVRIALEPDPNLRPGAFARAEVKVESSERPVLPQTAVLSDGRGTYVLIVNGDNRVERRSVRVASTNAQGIVISEGLDGSERVVTTAGAFLRPGEEVKVSPTGESAGEAAPAGGEAARGAS